MHPDAALYPAKEGNICTLAGLPPSGIKYEVLGTIVATKRSYGSSYELFPPMAAEARKSGADAVTELKPARDSKVRCLGAQSRRQGMDRQFDCCRSHRKSIVSFPAAESSGLTAL